jgi:uncharacterized protein YraI
MARLLRTLAFLILSVGLASSQTAVVTRNVNLRPDPSTHGDPIDILTSPTQVQLLDIGSTNGFLHVKVNNESGWVWSRNVRLQQTASSGTGRTEPTGGTLSATISSDWDKPSPQTASFESDEGACGQTGDGGDSDTNRRKNRTDVPASYHFVSWDAINTLDYAKGAPRTRMSWTAAQLATITPVEGTAITVEGFLYKVKVESSSANASKGGESTNCHAHLANDVDWHMPLTANLGDGEDAAIIVETSPRVRRAHSQWTTARLRPWTAHIGSKENANYNQQKVRISGWLMLDPEHKDMIDEGLRSTLWEIHPITKIEVWANGAWVDLDQQ